MARHSNKKKKSKKKSVKYNKNLELQTIVNTLNALISIGIIRKTKKKFYKNTKLEIDGTLKINSSGNGILVSDEDDEILIKKQYITNACNGDIVKARIYDYRRGFFYGKISYFDIEYESGYHITHT